MMPRSIIYQPYKYDFNATLIDDDGGNNAK